MDNLSPSFRTDMKSAAQVANQSKPGASLASGTADRPLVAIYRTQILPLSETFVRDQALALRRWHPVLVGERLIERLPLEGLPARAHHRGPPSLPQRVAGAMWRALDRPPPRSARILRTLRPDLVHAHFGFDGVEAWPHAKALGVPLLVTLHGSDITTSMDWFARGHGGRRWTSYPKRLAKLTEQRQVSFVAVSRNIHDAAIAAGLPPDRIFIRPIGIDTTRFTPTGRPLGERPPVVLFLGRLVEKKGCDYLIQAFQAVREQVPGAELVIAGDGPERARLAAHAPADAGIRFLGAVTRDQVQALLAQARVLCLPSITARNGDAEGLPLVILEAQASGVPVITSARGGVTEGIEDGETGYAFAERDVAALTERLLRLLTDDDLAERFSNAGPGFVSKHHDLQRCTAALEALYDDLTGRAA